jgi:hypothetical protein
MPFFKGGICKPISGFCVCLAYVADYVQGLPAGLRRT